MSQSKLDAFNNLTNKDCWMWSGTKDAKGYGRFWFDDKSQLAHRVSYELNYGAIPNGMCVMHKCDNRLCVNPAHLSLGTIADNIKDAVSKNRHAIGEKAARSHLNNISVSLIRFLFSIGSTQSALADWFNVSIATINSIVWRKTWKHIP